MSPTTVINRPNRNGLTYVPLVCALLFSALFLPTGLHAHASGSDYTVPTWWAKYQGLLKGNASPASLKAPLAGQVSVGANVDMSNEDGPQSETSITVNPNNSRMLVGGSNEIFRLPMRGYFSSDGGKSWGGVDPPLPPPATQNGTDFGSAPRVAFATHVNLYHSYNFVFCNRTFVSIRSTET